MSNDIICKAEIRREKNKKLFIIWYVLVGIVLVIGAIPTSRIREDKYLSRKITYYRFLFVDVAYKEEGITVKEDGYYVGDLDGWFHVDIDKKSPEEIEYIKEVYDEFGFRKQGEILPDVKHMGGFLAIWSLVLYMFAIIVLLIPIIRSKILSSIAGRCSLELSNKAILGARKKLFSTKEVNLPIDKIDSITCSTTLSDKLSGGKTISIRSVSGFISFPWVQNAEEFVDATLSKIDEYKNQSPVEMKNINIVEQNKVSHALSSSTSKIKELKELFDEGLISQDEYDTKRKELLEKM